MPSLSQQTLNLLTMTTMDDVSSVPKQDSRFSCNICLDPVTEPVVTQCGHLFCWPCLFRWLEPGIRQEEVLASWDVSPRVRVDESRRCCPVCKSECSVPTVVPIYVRNEPSTPLGSAKKAPRERDESNRDSVEAEGIEDSQEETNNTNNEEEARSSNIVEQDEDTPRNSITGLRQRLRFRSQDSEIPDIPPVDDVPSRPAANSPARPNRETMAIEPHRARAARAYAGARPPLSPHQASLSHGMLLLFQQALNSSDADNDTQQGRVPPLHQTSGDDDFNNGAREESLRDDATEFLSRLILILASFVILCLLLF